MYKGKVALDELFSLSSFYILDPRLFLILQKADLFKACYDYACMLNLQITFAMEDPLKISVAERLNFSNI